MSDLKRIWIKKSSHEQIVAMASKARKTVVDFVPDLINAHKAQKKENGK